MRRDEIRLYNSHSLTYFGKMPSSVDEGRERQTAFSVIYTDYGQGYLECHPDKFTASDDEIEDSCTSKKYDCPILSNG